MEKPSAGNDLGVHVTRFCLALEEDRRSPEGRIRTSQEFVDYFCPHDDSSCTDRIFRYLPNEVRGPILAAWGIRGSKTAMRDTDQKVQAILHESLVAGDIDHQVFEDGLKPQTIIRWIPLTDYWTFWRGGKLTKHALRKALETGDELGLFDAKWFLDTVEAQGGKLRGTEVLAEGLSKTDLTQWIRRIHESRDGSPRGILTALGWESVVSKTVDPVLIGAIDAMAVKVGLKLPVPVADTKPVAAAAAPAAKAGKAAAGGNAARSGGDAANDILTDDDLDDIASSPAPNRAAASPKGA